ncbi:hypothetical protein LWF01_04110 [Saxibacter everestensis]|uniref:Integral membrane protein n=1 Tax=Saxibacter everestensis TaxID=2909229 RepID=A0ABY8QVA2_9MICO|nr:hypothetical protein LWF01_04110 [Brevibacteriaceae bacterium ZFBP1038]
MIDLLTWLLLGASVLMALWALVLTFANKPTGLPVFFGLALVELLLLIQLVVAIVLFSQGADADGVLFFGYLLTAIIIVPAAGFWALAETSRWGAGVLTIGCATTAIMVERMVQIWAQ